MAGTTAPLPPTAPAPLPRRSLPPLLPGSVEVRDADASTPRTARDWAVDLTLFVLAVGTGALGFAGIDPQGDLGDVADAAGGVLLCGALWLRRRWPLGLALLATPIGAFSASSGGAGAILLFSLAVHRETRVVLAVAALQVPTILLYAAARPDPELSYWWLVLFIHVLLGLLIAWGTIVRARRLLVLSLQERADRAEAEQHRRVRQARDQERARIAREMHDVLAHRISLLSLHAGALEFRRDASPDEVAQAAGVIRASAHEALEDLRQVIGVLREAEPTADGPGGPPAAGSETRPQPGLGDLPALLQESRAAGMRIVQRLDADDGLPPGVAARTAYRVVQEGLTNARKHAWGTVVEVSTTGDAEQGVTVEVRTPAPVGGADRDPRIPGAGTGLVGLRERAALAGGRLHAAPGADGGFVLRAWLPWPS